MAPTDGSALPPLEDADDALLGCLASLLQAIEAADVLGIPTDTARDVHADGIRRLGFPSDAYVVALVGGTGVGKSSLLNALAGEPVSAASVRRPTTARPVAWLPGGRRDELEGLLDWLGVAPADIHAVGPAAFADLAVVDLPDLDSTSEDHRRRVEAVLPRVDAVVWVTDPEKYADAILQDEFLRTWLPRLDRQLIVLNKADRLRPDEAERVRRDLERDVERLAVAAGLRTPETLPAVVTTTARPAEPGTDAGADDRRRSADGVDGVSRWLSEQAEAKAVVRGRLRAAIGDAVRALGVVAGIRADTSETRPMLDPEARRRALDDATAALLRVVDVEELQRQAVAATRARARGRGAGPLGGLTSLLYRWSGRQARVADPLGFLARWRDRGGAARAVDPIRSAAAEPLRTAPPAVRGRVARAVDPAAVEASLGRAVDRAIAVRDD